MIPGDASGPETAAGGGLVVHEAGRRWIPLLRELGRSRGISVQHTVTQHDCLQAISRVGGTPLIVVLGKYPAEELDLITSVFESGAGSVMLVLAPGNWAWLERPARELGATAFWVEPVPVRELEDWVDRAVRTRSPGISGSGKQEAVRRTD